MAAKLGLPAPDPELVDGPAGAAARPARRLHARSSARSSAGTARSLFVDREPFDAWAARREALLPADRAAVAAAMDRVNPVYIPRNHRVEEALTAATAGDLGPFRTLLDVVSDPYDAAARPGGLRAARARRLRPVRHLLRHLTALHRGRVVLARERDGAVEQGVRHAAAAVPGAHPEAPHRPHRQVVDVRDLPRTRERQLGRAARRPPSRPRRRRRRRAHRERRRGGSARGRTPRAPARPAPCSSSRRPGGSGTSTPTTSGSWGRGSPRRRGRTRRAGRRKPSADPSRSVPSCPDDDVAGAARRCSAAAGAVAARAGRHRRRVGRGGRGARRPGVGGARPPRPRRLPRAARVHLRRRGRRRGAAARPGGHRRGRAQLRRGGRAAPGAAAGGARRRRCGHQGRLDPGRAGPGGRAGASGPPRSSPPAPRRWPATCGSPASTVWWTRPTPRWTRACGRADRAGARRSTRGPSRWASPVWPGSSPPPRRRCCWPAASTTRWSPPRSWPSWWRTRWWWPGSGTTRTSSGRKRCCHFLG